MTRQSSQSSLFEQFTSQAKELVRETTRQSSQDGILAQMDKVLLQLINKHFYNKKTLTITNNFSSKYKQKKKLQRLKKAKYSHLLTRLVKRIIVDRFSLLHYTHLLNNSFFTSVLEETFQSHYSLLFCSLHLKPRKQLKKPQKVFKLPAKVLWRPAKPLQL